MVYYYFKTKDDLFLAVVEEIYSRLLGDMTEALDPAFPPRERLRRLYVRVGQISDEELDVVRLVLREVLVSSARLERLVERFQRGHLPLVFATLADGYADGSIDASLHPSLALMAALVLGTAPQMMRRIAGKHLPYQGIPEGEALSNALIEVLFCGIGTQSRRVSGAAQDEEGTEAQHG
jgi:AcrR family transcriptional regulator